METTYAFTYEVMHPAFSEPIYLDSHIEREPHMVQTWAAVWLERKFPDTGWNWLAERRDLQVTQIENSQ